MTIVRPITDRDISPFRNVLDRVCRERKYLAQLEAPSMERVAAFVRSNIQSGYPQFVAEDGTEIVGWCDAIPGDELSGTRHVARLGMGLLPSHRGQNIGRRLIEATIERAKEIGMEKIELTVHASNVSAIALYRRVGFLEEGRRIRAWLVDEIYDDILLMAKNLQES